MDPNKNCRNYVPLPSITTLSTVIFAKNCINLDIDIDLPVDTLQRYSSCIINSYKYSIIDPVTLKGHPVMTGSTYRCRLKRVSIGDGNRKNKIKQQQINMASLEVNSWIMKTSGVFICVVSDIDTFNRILVELYDPVTGVSINDHILNKYKDTFVEYHPMDYHIKPRYLGHPSFLLGGSGKRAPTHNIWRRNGVSNHSRSNSIIDR